MQLQVCSSGLLHVCSSGLFQVCIPGLLLVCIPGLLQICRPGLVDVLAQVDLSIFLSLAESVAFNDYPGGRYSQSQGDPVRLLYGSFTTSPL